MRPVLLTVAGVPVYAYGTMLALAFLAAALSLRHELGRRGLDRGLVLPTLLISMVSGLAGARLFAVLDAWRLAPGDPWAALTAAGLTFPGGFLCALAALQVDLRRRRVSFLAFADANACGLALAYALARLGCQLAGDGDYGLPSALPWAMAYPRGVVPTSLRVHPTPVYETIFSLALFVLLRRASRPPRPEGGLFAWYLAGAGAGRFLVELVRRNPPLALGLTQAQWISAGLVLAGLVLLRQRVQNVRVWPALPIPERSRSSWTNGAAATGAPSTASSPSSMPS